MKPLIYQYRMQWRELLQCVGIVPDHISSLVHAFGIRLKKQEIWHPAYEAFCQMCIRDSVSAPQCGFSLLDLRISYIPQDSASGQFFV